MQILSDDVEYRWYKEGYKRHTNNLYRKVGQGVSKETDRHLFIDDTIKLGNVSFYFPQDYGASCLKNNNLSCLGKQNRLPV